MSAFLYRLGRSCARHPFRVLGLWFVAAFVVMSVQGSVGGEYNDTFRVPGVESQQATDILQGPLPQPVRCELSHRVPHRQRASRRRDAPRQRRSGSSAAVNRTRRHRGHGPVRTRTPRR